MKYDTIAVIFTGAGEVKLLGVPKIAQGAGDEQAQACLMSLDEWDLQKQVYGLVFDTTASNTGLHKGACIHIEKAVGRELVWIACRHHILEVVLKDVCGSLFGATVGPDMDLYKQFQKQWPSINHESFKVAPDKIFVGEMVLLRQEMLAYLPEALKSQKPRDDYQELLILSLIFLGGHTGVPPTFRAPGPTHHARWMSKAIYALKIFLFQDQV